MRPLAAIGLTLLLAACTREPPPSLILISLDTTRADHMGFLGSVTVATPRLDELAEQSLVFEEYQTVAPSTLASHTSLFTGTYPHHHGVPRNGFAVHPDNVLLPEVLQSAGYRTAGFAASFALDRRFGIGQGFDHWDQSFDLKQTPGSYDQNQRRAEDVTDAVLDYLSTRDPPEPLFLFVHYFDPHAPYFPPDDFDRRYDPAGHTDFPTLGEIVSGCRAATELPTPDALRLSRHYAAEITYLDHHVGRLLDGLRERGLLDRSLVLLTSDHGENHWDHETFFSHGESVYQSTMRAVALLRQPDLRGAGQRSDRVLASVDMLPTILSLLGLDLPSGIDGEPVPLDGSDPGGRIRFGQATKWAGASPPSNGWPNRDLPRFVRRGRFKLVQSPRDQREELFDLQADPDETHNLLASPSPEHEAVVRELRPLLEQWVASARPLPSAFVQDDEGEAAERLRSLGYLGE